MRDRRRSSSTPTLTEYDFGPDHPMSPLRVDLTMRLAARPRRRSATGLRVVPAPVATDDLIATVHDAALIEAVQRGRPAPGARTTRRRARHRRQPGLPGHARGRRARRRRHRRGVPPGLDGRSRCTAPTSPAACTTRCRTGPAASASTTTSRSASAGCSTRAPSGWPTSTSTSTTATASSRSSGTTRGCSPSPCTRPAQVLFPGTGFPRDLGGPGAEGTAVNVALPPGTARRRLAARLPRRGARPAARVRARRPGHPARLRLARRRPARAPDAHRRRPAGGVPRPARPGPRGRRRPLGRHRRGRLRRWSTWCRGPGRHLLGDRRRARRWTRRPRRRRPGASTCATSLRPHRRRTGSPTGATPAYRRLGARATTPTPGSTGRSTRPARRSSRCTASTRCPDLGRARSGQIGRSSACKPTRRDHSTTFVNLFPTSHIRPYSHVARHVGHRWGSRWRAAQKDAVCTMAADSGDMSDVEVPDRRRGRGDDARLEDDGLPPGPQRRAARRPGRPLVPGPRGGRRTSTSASSFYNAG